MPVIRRAAPLPPAAAVAVTGLLLLAAVVAAALQWPDSWTRGVPPDVASLGYARPTSTFDELTDDYIRSVLGEREHANDEAGERAPFGRGGVSAGTSPTARPHPAGDVIVAHRLTNDDFEDAFEVNALPFTARSDASEATRQAGEPADCFPRGGTTWYRYRAAAPVAFFANTFGTAGATALAVYAGERLGDLRLLRCDANAAGNAQAGFQAEPGITYYFQLTSMVRGGAVFFEARPMGVTETISVTPTGAEPDGADYLHPEISADGRYVVFASNATNLTMTAPRCDGAERCSSVYLRDRLTGVTERIIAVAPHAASYSVEEPEAGVFATLSADGRYVGFNSADNSFPGRPADAPANASNVYVYDRTTERFSLASRNSAGEPADADPASCPDEAPGCELFGSTVPSLSRDGRYVTFHSDGTNMGGPYHGPTMVATLNVYVRDRETGVTRLASVDPSGEPIPGGGHVCKGRNVSDSGRFVAFSASTSTSYEMWATSAFTRVYLWDARTGKSRAITELSSEASRGSYCPTISADGHRVGFVSRDALVPEDTNGTADAYVYDVPSGALRRVSVTSAGGQTYDPNVAGDEGNTFIPTVTLSADGRFVAFDSAAPDLVPGSVGSTTRQGEDAPGPRQCYVHDLVTGATTLVSVSSTGEPLAGESVAPYISDDGRSVAFMNRGRTMVHELR